MTREIDTLSRAETDVDILALSTLIPGRQTSPTLPDGEREYLLGVIPGEGIGPEVMAAALTVLAGVEPYTAARFEVREGGDIGHAAISEHGTPLPDEISDFCAGVFGRFGAVLSGPGGGRFVYELRKRFDLFCKINPVRPWFNLDRRSSSTARHPVPVDLVIVRENVGGVYQGSWRDDSELGRGRAEHSFIYEERQVRRILEVAAAIAAVRSGELSVVVKAEGLPSISRLWRRCADEICSEHGIGWECVDVDLAAYRLASSPDRFDVVAAPNLFGDILIDLSSVHLGGRALGCSGNFDDGTAAVYQTNHGAAHDLAGTDRANPVGQILALAMLLRESFGLGEEASMVEEAICNTWRDGYRTADLPSEDGEVVGTERFAAHVAERIGRLASRPSP